MRLSHALVAASVVLAVGLSGCSEAMSENNANVFYYTDPDTGVQYVVYKAFEKGGICPRYNADGTLRTEGD